MNLSSASAKCLSKSGLILLLQFVMVAAFANPFPSDSTRVHESGQDNSEQIDFPQIHVGVREGLPDPIVITSANIDDSVAYYRAYANEQEEEVKRKGSFITSLNSLSLLELPVGLVREVGPITYTVVISKVSVTPAGSFIEAYLQLEIPDTGDRIAFRGVKIPFSNGGGFSGIGRLELVGHYPIKINQTSLVTLLGRGETFIEFDCNGFKGMGLQGKVEFSRDLILPEDERGIVKPSPARVETTFTTYAQSWSDLLFDVSLPPFQINGLNDVTFQVDEAYFDWSDIANPSGLTFPSGYENALASSGNANLWRGFYLSRLAIKLPPSFTRRGDNARLGFNVRDLILDEHGVTGTFAAQNVLQHGDMSGWSYSIDEVSIGIVLNQVAAFGLRGKISIPRINGSEGKAANFGYRAHRAADGNYVFAISIPDNVTMPFILADLNLYPGSSVTVIERDNRFFPTARLNGSLGIKGLSDGVDVSFLNIRFEGLVISSEAPHFDIQALAFGGSDQQKVSDYPIVVNNIQVKKDDQQRFGIGFDLSINIGGAAADDGFSGTGMLTVWGKQSNESVKDSEGNILITQENNWQFDNVELGGIAINIQKPKVFEFQGTLQFFHDDAVYGEGFKGILKGGIHTLGNIEAHGLFGKTPSTRYWFADALLTLKTAAPIVPGVLYASGFGGGYYHKMKQSDRPIASSLGEGPSGLVYIPDENSRGIRAIMKIQAARPEAVNGDVSLELVLNRHGGINSTTFSGNANFMNFAAMAEDKIKELAGAAASGKLAEKLSALISGQVYGSMHLHYDNVNNVFHGNLEVYVNVAAGLLRGVSDGNKAGWATMHFEQNDWYVLIGTPDQPLGLEVAKIFQAKSYFMVGKNLPGSPPPPSQVTEILGNIDLDYMRDMNALQSGAGLAFGLHFLVDTGDLTFLMFYGRFSAGTGLDFMLKDYGNATCAAASGKVGINGWYANGQAYAFVMGKIGIKVDLKFYKGEYEILAIGAAAVLQAKGPNPFWMQGVVGGYYRILGGVVKGKCSFKVTVGEECTPIPPSEGVSDVLARMNLISQMSPSQGSTEVDVFNTPQVAFNIAIGRQFHIADGLGGTRTFRSTLDFFKVTNGSEELQGNLTWNEEQDVVIFNGHDILPGQKTLKASVKIGFEELKLGRWVRISGGDESAECSFTTAKAPDVIPENNILYAYPLKGQANFYSQEHSEGLIQLRVGQAYLFDSEANKWSSRVRLTDVAQGSFTEGAVSYNAAEKKVSFNVPSGIKPEKIYKLNIIRLPVSNQSVDANVSKLESITVSDADNIDTLSVNVIEGQMEQLEEKALYSSHFRTSRYKTFAEKMTSLSLSQTFRSEEGRTAFNLLAYLQGAESFDAFEIDPANPNRFVKMEAVLEDNSWFEKYAYPVVYEGYPLYPWLVIQRRDTAVLGTIPTRNVYFEYFNEYSSIGEDVTSFTFKPFDFESVVYGLGEIVDGDFNELQLLAVDYFIDRRDEITERVSKLLLNPAPYVRYGRYRIRLNYTIPGLNKTTSSYDWQLFNEIRDN